MAPCAQLYTLLRPRNPPPPRNWAYRLGRYQDIGDIYLCTSAIIGLRVQVRSLSLYLAELSLVDGENFLRHQPSQVQQFFPTIRCLWQLVAP